VSTPKPTDPDPIVAILEEAKNDLALLQRVDPASAGRLVHGIARKAYRAGYDAGYEDGYAYGHKPVEEVRTT